MPVHNTDIADLFDETADLLEIENANPFRVQAYRNAAQTLRDLGTEVKDLLARGTDLTRLPGIGKDLAAKITGIVDSGRFPVLDQLHGRLPHTLTELLKLPGLGPKRVRALQQDLGIQTMEQLHRAARDGHIRELPGFGEKTELHILEMIEARGIGARRKLADADPYARALADYLRQIPGVREVTVAGSYRRAKETVGDLDIVVVATTRSAVMKKFVAYEDVAEVISHGTTRAAVRLRNGLQVDLRRVPQKSYGAALHYFTGSKAHNIAIRRCGQEKGLKVNEYGVFRGKKRIAGDTEESVYKAVDLPFIAVELRENRGEIEAARAGRLPHLIELKDLRGNLHTHTKATDGHNSLREMALAAREYGLEYLAITEHSRRVTMAHGLDPTRLLQQIDEIDALNGELSGITLLKGIEVDILEDGSLDLPDKVLAKLDLVVGAVHSHFNLSRTRQTKRILRAMEQPYFTILAHPGGRLIQQREACDIDMTRIIRHAGRHGRFLELNAQPKRLDLIDVHCRAAKDEGVLISIAADAHSVLEFDNLRFGIGQARRGWLERDDVLNSRSLDQLRSLLQRAYS